MKDIQELAWFLFPEHYQLVLSRSLLVEAQWARPHSVACFIQAIRQESHILAHHLSVLVNSVPSSWISRKLSSDSFLSVVYEAEKNSLINKRSELYSFSLLVSNELANEPRSPSGCLGPNRNPLYISWLIARLLELLNNLQPYLVTYPSAFSLTRTARKVLINRYFKSQDKIPTKGTPEFERLQGKAWALDWLVPSWCRLRGLIKMYTCISDRGNNRFFVQI